MFSPICCLMSKATTTTYIRITHERGFNFFQATKERKNFKPKFNFNCVTPLLLKKSYSIRAFDSYTDRLISTPIYILAHLPDYLVKYLRSTALTRRLKKSILYSVQFLKYGQICIQNVLKTTFIFPHFRKPASIETSTMWAPWKCHNSCENHPVI